MLKNNGTFAAVVLIIAADVVTVFTANVVIVRYIMFTSNLFPIMNV